LKKRPGKDGSIKDYFTNFNERRPFMARIPAATRESVPQNQRETFDRIVQIIGSVPKYGPNSILVNVPEASQRASALNQYLRNESSLPKKIQEFTMLITAREKDCQHIWNAHAASARQAGLRDEIINALRDKKELPQLAPDEEAVLNYARALFRTHHASRGAFQAALEQFGVQGLVELTLLMGNYAMLALVINSFDTDLPPERSEPLLPV
jgi:4-carboxymuconolactone decarboxylase